MCTPPQASFANVLAFGVKRIGVNFEARQSQRVERAGECDGLDPRRAETLEGLVRAAADGHVRRLEQRDAGVEQHLRLVAQVRAWILPFEAGFGPAHRAPPAFAGDDLELAGDVRSARARAARARRASGRARAEPGDST
jgi:hypothetical protein